MKYLAIDYQLQLPHNQYHVHIFQWIKDNFLTTA